MLFFVVSSCITKENSSKEEGKYTLLLDSIPLKDTLRLSSLFKEEVTTFLLDTVSAAMLGQIDKMAAYNDKIIILDGTIKKQILVYDKTGHFLYPIGKVGQAPGEYTAIDDFAYSNQDNLLFILDSRARRIFAYQLDTGLFVYSMKLNHDCIHIHCFNGALYTDHPTFNRNQKAEYLLVKIDKNNGEIIHSYIEPEKYNQGFDRPLSNNGGPFLLSKANEFTYSLMFANTVFTISEDNVVPHLVLKSAQWICKKDLENIDVDNDPEGMFKIIKKEKYYNLNKYIERKTFIFCSIEKGFTSRYLYYDKKNKSALFTSLLIEDILSNNANFEYLRLQYGGSDDKGAYFYLSPSAVKVLVEEKELYKDSKFDAIRNLGDNFNGAIFYYAFKK